VLRVPELTGCAADVDRLAALTPRVSMGYHRLDVNGFSASVVAETPPTIATALGKLMTAAPGVSWPLPGKPLFAMAMAADVGAVMALLGDMGNAMAARPFTCSALASLNDLGKSLSGLANTSLPPIVSGLRGVSLVVDEATIDPPGGVGHALVVSEQMESLPMFLAFVPGLSGLDLKTDGTPVALPVDQLGVAWIGAAHAALRGDRAVITVGTDSARRATEELKAPVPQRSPLLALTYDIVRFRQLSPQFADALGAYSFREAGMALEIVEQGVRLLVEGTW
jgi:hypothetical protein